MILKELIDILKQYPESTRVIVSGYEGGYCDIDSVEKIPIQLNVNPTHSYCGPHEKVSENKKHEDAIAII
jgi:hypothetical protein